VAHFVVALLGVATKDRTPKKMPCSKQTLLYKISDKDILYAKSCAISPFSSVDFFGFREEGLNGSSEKHLPSFLKSACLTRNIKNCLFSWKPIQKRDAYNIEVIKVLTPWTMWFA